jgi:hypothetical protein
LENAKKNLVFHFEGGRHASFPQKPVVKQIFSQKTSRFYTYLELFATLVSPFKFLEFDIMGLCHCKQASQKIGCGKDDIES